jgi:hypothetical protein
MDCSLSSRFGVSRKAPFDDVAAPVRSTVSEFCWPMKPPVCSHVTSVCDRTSAAEATMGSASATRTTATRITCTVIPRIAGADTGARIP